MNRYFSLLLVLTFGILSGANCPVDTAKRTYHNSPERPNIVWITCEDIGPVFPMYGDSTIKTPNLSWLAANGVVFNNAFSVSGVCSPSRAALITGMYPTTIGTHNHRSQFKTHPDIDQYEVVPPGYVKTFTEHLRQAGYYCSNQFKTDYNFGGGIVKAPISSFDTISNEADWSGRAEGQPFFAIFNHNITHMFGLWKRNKEPLRVSVDSVSVPTYFPTTKKARTSIARQYDNAMILDEQVGEILDRLRAENLLDNTIIFFFSDHGDGMPRNKIWLYDSGIRVPLIVRFPDHRRAGSVDDRLVSFVDFAPTVLQLANVTIPDHFQGGPFLPLEEAPEEREYIFAAKDRIDFEEDRIRAVRNKQYKYIRNYFPERPYIQNFPWSDSIYITQEWKRLYRKDSLTREQKLFFRKTRPEEELYDITNDPYEVNNLASQVEYRSVLEKLRAVNDEHVKRTGDLGFVNENKLRLDFWPNGQQPTTARPIFSVSDGRVTISSPTEGASIVYKLHDDQKTWKLYHRPIPVEDTQATLSARAVRYGYEASQTAHLNE